jgi:hypothetical protein
MHFFAASLLLAQLLPFQPLSGVAGKASGDARLVCQTDWHNLNLALSFKGTIELSPQELRIFQPPPDARLDEPWNIRDQQVLPLLRILHGLDWKPPAADEAAYQKWRGELTRAVALQPTGSLSLAYVKSGQGYRLEFSGRIRALEVKAHGNRFGPNYQQDQWTHDVLGAIALTSEGVPYGLEIRDAFEVAGRFHNGGDGPADSNRREGTLLVAMPVTAPVNASEAAEIKRLIGRLGDDSFNVREQAMRDLSARTAAIAPYLRQFGLTHGDAEVRERSQWLLRKLLDE